MSTPRQDPPGAAADSQGARTQLPVHAWAWFDEGWRPAVLLRWIRYEDGTWAGEVITVDNAGDAGHFALAAGLLRPANAQLPERPTRLAGPPA